MKTIYGFLLGFSLAAVAAQDVTPKAPTFKAVEIDSKIEIGYGVTVADINGDKKPDIILADKNQIVWYQNPTWEKHIIAEKLTKLDHVCIAARDIDGDGKAELAAGAGWNPSDTANSGAVFYLVAPADRTQKWEPVELPHEPTVHRMRWVKTADGKFNLVVVPLHGRGNNPGAGTGDGAKILAYKMPANPKSWWTTEVLDSSMHKTHNFDPVPWDNDSAEALLIAGKEGVFLLNQPNKTFKMTQLSGAESGGAGEVRLGKLSNGKRFFATVEPMHGTNLVLYTEPPGWDGKTLWHRHLLDSSLVDGHALACGNLTGTGGDQIVVGWRAMGKPNVRVGVKLFLARDPEGKQWEQTLVDDNGMACEDLCLADLDGDGKLDIVAAGRATKNVKIYFNQRGN
jgi:hypothetical protein